MPPIPPEAQEKDEKPIHNPWLEVRSLWTNQAIQDGDLKALRRISALPGGFGGEEERRRAWAFLLGTSKLDTASSEAGSSKPAVTTQPILADATEQKPEEQKEQLEVEGDSKDNGGPQPHKDEPQVKLDTDRSFVIYPKGISSENKLAMQEDLNDLIVNVLRKYPALSYFQQGYHDILSVLYLTFIPAKQDIRRPSFSLRRRTRSRSRSGWSTPTSVVEEKVTAEEEKLEFEPLPDQEPGPKRDTQAWRDLRKCAESVSLNRVRDAMGSNLGGMMALLRILKRLLAHSDPELSHFSSLISPVPTLPFFALSWVLTLFSHDCDSLEPVQRMFDYLLARNPIAAVYLSTSILISKKSQLFEFAKKLGREYQEDPSLLHPLFVRLPPLYPDTPPSPNPPMSPLISPSKLELHDPDVNPYSAIRLSDVFQLADRLMEEYPWDGSLIRGGDIMGPGSVVVTYDQEWSEEGWTPEKALKYVDVDVVQPGAAVMDEDEPVPSPISRRVTNPDLWKVLKRVKPSTLVALGVVFLGVGMAVYGVKLGGRSVTWRRVVAGIWQGARKVYQESNLSPV
ncbi:hypothetical protein I315_05104 [Cryptococcus gattii Ru294]|nr:hypothetical protein I315_05104 [Cryptococcus gattii Ru294]